MTTQIAVVFVTTNERHLLVPALESLYAAPPSKSFEVVVVDNASKDGASATVAERWPQVTILNQTSRRSLAANLNLAMGATSTPYAMWCDADMLFKPKAPDALAEFLDANVRAGIVKPKLVSPQGDLRASVRRWYTPGALLALRGPWSPLLANSRMVRASLYADWDYVEARRVDWLPFAGVMVRRKAFQEVDGVDERFPFYFEDVDLSLRMHEAGWEVWCQPASVMVHLENRASVDVMSRAGGRHLVSLFKFMWKHKGLRPRQVA